MARTKVVTVNGTDYTLQSVTFSWYTNLTDLYINPANGRKNTAKYVDALLKGCVTAPAEVAKRGLEYFEEQDDITTPSWRRSRPVCSGRTSGIKNKPERRDDLWMKPAA